ncbi:uncharacterized protein LOC110462484 [Mizuhopecten yessoensis]|uniref:CABIT domain-containing protein n=1 Tax=Mizuhopecten yessoensis TaxID=6573 RepID=A0A210R6Q7_MIZYE|nr:uncharacterized protein LOC110462484 [Mizuhopecten yessoensis]OWF56737.1 hypothetical protein KP79_PYT15163 [Mizuhopecten yessoensis]
MAEFSLASVLNSLVYPTTVRIASGGLTATEGKHFRPDDVLILYGSGLRVYVPPSANAALRERCRTADTTKRTRRRLPDDGGDEYSNTNNLFTKNIFVSEKANLKDNKFAGKVYRDVAEILSDSPFSVKANKSFFVCGDEQNPNEIRKIFEGEVIHIDPHIDRANMNILRGHVDGKRVSMQLSNTSISVTALPELNSEATARPAAHMSHVDFGLPKEMVYEDQDIQETYQIEVGFNVIPLQERPMLSVCCSKRQRSVEELDNGMLKIQNIWCFNFNEQSIKTVTVQVLNTDVESSFKPAFGKEVDRDENDFSFYNLYGKQCTVEYLEPTAKRIPEIKPRATPWTTDKPPPLPTRNQAPNIPIRPSSRRSDTLNSLPEAPPPPTQKRHPILPTQHEEPLPLVDDKTKQASSPTFIKSQFPEEDIPTKTLPQEHESVHSLSNISLSDQGGPNSTDEQKMSPSSEVSTADKSSHNTTSGVPDDLEIYTKDIKDMTISELANLFRSNRLDHMANVCEEEVIDGVLLLILNDQDFQKEPFNLTDYHLKKLKKLIEGHRPR